MSNPIGLMQSHRYATHNCVAYKNSNASHTKSDPRVPPLQRIAIKVRYSITFDREDGEEIIKSYLCSLLQEVRHLQFLARNQKLSMPCRYRGTASTIFALCRLSGHGICNFWGEIKR
ncbi:hypothetical protein, partial [Microseira wollei]|uniref:hypothetical protein n=1 Tax=Microseira wollei TaxID=467598 RepID=UPI001CFED07E